MSFIHDNCKSLIGRIHFLIDDRELLKGSDNYPCPVLDGLLQLLRVLVDLHDHAFHMVELVDCILQLAVKDAPVRDDDNGLEDLFIICIMKTAQAVGKPGNGIRFAGTGTVLDQIILPRTVDLHIREQLGHDIQLVVSREDHALRLNLTGLFITINLQMQILLQYLKQPVPAKDVLPEISSVIAVRIVGIALPPTRPAPLLPWLKGRKFVRGPSRRVVIYTFVRSTAKWTRTRSLNANIASLPARSNLYWEMAFAAS